MMLGKLYRPFVAAPLTLSAASGFAAYGINIPQPDTVIAQQIYGLHLYILGVCAAIFVIVFGWMFIALLKHRKSVGHRAGQFHDNPVMDVVWTIIPFLILVALAFPATRTVLAMKDVSKADMTIKVTGYQWKWEYDYQQDGIRFFSTLATPREDIEGGTPKGEYLLEVDNPRVVPVGKKIRLLVTASDSIHGWYVPQLGVNQYGIPGFIKDTWFNVDHPGIYKGQCSQICGKEHGYMPITVVAKSEADYATWVDEQKKKQAAGTEDGTRNWSLDELRAKGAQVFAANCQVCHQANGTGVPGAFPAVNGSKVVLGPKTDEISLVLKGKNAMPAWGSQLSDSEIAAVITYTRNAWDNRTGEAIQPGEIKGARG